MLQGDDLGGGDGDRQGREIREDEQTLETLEALHVSVRGGVRSRRGYRVCAYAFRTDLRFAALRSAGAICAAAALAAEALAAPICCPEAEGVAELAGASDAVTAGAAPDGDAFFFLDSEISRTQ